MNNGGVERRALVTQRECDRCNDNFKQEIHAVDKKVNTIESRLWYIGAGMFLALAGIVGNLIVSLSSKADAKSIAEEVVKVLK